MIESDPEEVTSPPEPPVPPLSQRLRRALVPLLLIVVTGISGFQLFELIDHTAVNVLFSDQWEYMEAFFSHSPSWTELFFHQHGPHREGVGLVVDKYLYAWTSWNTRAESFLIFGCVFAAMLLAILLKKKLFGSLSYTDVAIPMMFLTMSQFATFVETPNAAYSGFPLLLIMLYCLALLRPRYQIRYALILVLNFLVTYTGFGIFMGLVTVGLFALECFWRARGVSDIPLRASLGALVLAIATLASFFIHYRFNPAVDCFVFPYYDLTAYPKFVSVMVARYLTLPGPAPVIWAVCTASLLAGAAILVALAVRLVRRERFEPADLVVGVLLTYTVMFCANTAIGRVCLGLPAALASRYSTLLIPGVLGVYLYLQSIRLAAVRNIGLFVLIVLLIPGCLVVQLEPQALARSKRAWVSCYLLTDDIEQCDRTTGRWVYPRKEEVHLKEKLNYLKEHHLNLFADY